MVSAQAFPDLGGIESHVAEVSQRLVRAGWEIDLLTTDRSGTLLRHELRDGVRVRRFRSIPRERDYYFSPGLFFGLVLRLLRRQAGLVHIQGIHTLVPPLAMLAAWVTKTPYVLTFHTGGNSSAFRTKMRSRQFRILGPLLRRADQLIAVSEFEGKLFEETLGLPPGSITVIRNGGSLPELTEAVAPVAGRIVSLGRLERYKGHHRVIEALPRLLETHPDAHVRVLGQGPYESELVSLAESLGVRDRVSVAFIPPLERHLMATELAQAGVVCLISDYEAHPVAVMEAISLARPAVIARTSGLTEVADAGWATGVTAADDSAEVAAALASQLNSPQVPDRSELPTWETCVAAVETIYRSHARVEVRS